MARVISSNEYQELGKRYYKFKEYEKALENFTKAVEAAVNPTVNLYDCRAATYDKLGNLNEALKDGREMIRVDKKDVKGYLRTGSLLQKVDKLAKAVDIYKYGMKNVPVVNKGFQYLQQLHDQLTRKLSPANAVDPFTVLPVELVEMVISYLPFRAMVNCLRVCKGWKLYLTKCSSLWRDLDLSGARRDVSRAFVRDAFKYSAYNIERATFHRFRHLDVLRNLATACKTLTRIEFLSGMLMSDAIIEVAQCAQNLKTLILHNEVSGDTVQEILRFRPTLHHVEFHNITSRVPILNTDWKGPFSNLHTMVFNCNDKRRLGMLALPRLFASTPILRSFSLANCEVMAPRPSFAQPQPNTNGFHGLSSLSLTNLVLEDFRYDRFPQLPTTLKSLTLQPVDLKPCGAFLGPQAVEVMTCLPDLTHLSLSRFQDIDSNFLALILGGPTLSDAEQGALLEHFSIEGCTTNGPLDLDLLSHTPRIISGSLRSLNLAGHQIGDDEVMGLFAMPAPPINLKTINLSRTQVSGAGIKRLIDSIPSLELVAADDCGRVSSRDIVDYGKKRGVRVSINVTGMGGGRRVRYG